MDRNDVLALLRTHRSEIESFGVESLRLFGSVARGEAAADSDVDLLVSFRQTPTFSGYMKLRIFLEDLLGARVDLITESGLRDGVRPFVEKDAIRVA
jgi:uncharacterized protein